MRTLRSAEKLKRMLEEAPTQRLRTVAGDYTTPAGAHTLVSWLNSHAQNGLDHVVSIHGGAMPSGKLTEVKGGDFAETMHAHVLPHIVLAQACIPHLLDKQDSSYSVVTGGMGEECLKTDQALLTVANAASYGVAEALRAQLNEAGVTARVNEMRICAVVRRDDAVDNPAFPGMPAVPSSKLASVICEQLQGTVRNEVLRISVRDILSAPEEPSHEAHYAEGEAARIAMTPKVSGKLVESSKPTGTPGKIYEEERRGIGARKFAEA